METRNSRPDSLDDVGLWMKIDSNPVTNNTECTWVTSGGKPQDETKAIPAAPAVTTAYYSVMDDEGADDVFIPPPPPLPPPLPNPSSTAPLLPAEGSTGTTAKYSGVTLSNGAGDATEAKANPSGLGWHHGEKQLMAAQNERDEVRASTVQTFKESMDNVLLSNDKDSPPPTDQDPTSMDGTGCLMETCHDSGGGHDGNNPTANEESNEDLEDNAVLSEGHRNLGETEADINKYPEDLLSKHKDNSENESSLEEDEDKPQCGDICGFEETDSKLSRENLDPESVETNTPTLPGLSVNNDDLKSSEPAELHKCNQNKTDTATSQPQVADSPVDVTSDDEAHVDSRSLDYNLTKCNWVRRESGTTEMQVSQFPISTDITRGEQEDGSRRIATDIQQGEQLLQRLQLVQLRHDVHMPENPDTLGQVVKESKGEEKCGIETEVEDLRGGGGGNLLSEEEKDQSRSLAVGEEYASLVEKENNESEDVQINARTSSSTMPEEHQRIATTEQRDSEDEQSDSWTPADLSTPINPHETLPPEIQCPSTRHRMSAAETSMEKHIQEAAQRKQNLQRAGGVFNLADNPDVLEIPFKTNISLESPPSKVATSHRSDWQFSEQKMQKEISQEIQRELVLVNQGKIPGEYSKGEVRQLKETKLLFEAFQHDNTGGPTRHRKPPNAVMKGPVVPSVLERTRSLEMFSLKSCPVARAQSLRLYKSATSEREKSPENLRSKSPTGGSRDKTRLSPYSKQDKHLRLYKSMDSIRTEAFAVETRGKTREGGTGRESPILKHNPFFKLRPALALQPEVEKDIREAKEREEELRRQRCSLYGENKPNREDDEKSRRSATLRPDVRQQSRGKLERVWPPPTKKDEMKSEQTQQEPKVHRAGGQKAPLWQRWEAGLINGQPANQNK